MRKLQVRFLVGFVTVLGLCGGGIYLLHRVQMARNASSLLNRARTAEAGGNLTRAEESLDHYLSLKSDDNAAWAWFARITDQQNRDDHGRERVFLIHEEALQRNPHDRQIERRCAELALGLGRYTDARRHLTKLQGAIQAAPDKAAEAELEDLLGQCDQPESGLDQAEQHYRQAIALDSTRVATFDRLARLLRQNLKNAAAADSVIENMLEANPKNALAHVTRWRYHREFGPAPDGSDIAEALKLGPDVTEVLIAAAELALQDKKPDVARKHIERGIDLYPESAVFYLMSASLEGADNHPDRAEAILRRGVAAVPVPSNRSLKMLLTETLLIERKLEGDEGAIAWIDRLRQLGLHDGYTAFLEGWLALAQQDWRAAISRLDTARVLLAGDSVIVSRINMLLAECHERTGETEKHVAALERAARGEQTAVAAGLLLAQTMESEGRIDDAIKAHVMLVAKRPQSRLDLVRLLILKNSRLPVEERRLGEVKQRLQEAEQAVPKAVEDLTRLSADLLVAQNRFEEARKVLTAALLKDPRNLNFRLALARIAQTEANTPLALQTLDQAEKDLGPSLAIQLARLDLWSGRGGDQAKASVAHLAAGRTQMSPDDLPPFLDRLARSELRLREPGLARQYWGELLALPPDKLTANPNKLTTLRELFELSIQNNDLAGARELEEKIRQIEGDLTGTYWRFARASLALEEYRRDPGNPAAKQKLSEAGELASKIYELRPGWWGWPVLKGQIAELNGSADEAIEQFKLAIKLGDRQPSLATRLLAMAYGKTGEQGDQIAQVTDVLRANGIPVESLKIFNALDAIGRGDTALGVRLAREALPESSAIYYEHVSMGRIYTAAGKPAEAGKEFRRAVELAPGVPDTWLFYVQHLATETRQVDKAREAVQAAARALPPNQAAPTLARCWMMIGDSRQAEAEIQKAIKDHPDDPATLRNLVRIYLDEGRIAEAEASLGRFEKLTNRSADDDAWASRIRPVLLLRTGRLADQDRALQLVEKNLKTNPGSREDRQLKIGILAMRPSGRGEAIKLLEQLGGTGALSTSDRFMLADLHLREGHLDQYEKEILEIVGPGKANPPRAVSHFVEYLIRRDRLDQAGRELDRLKKIDPLGLVTLGLEASLLHLRKRSPELLALLQEHGRKIPDHIGPVADLLAAHGFAGEAEQAYKTYIARDPRQPERTLALARFYASQGRMSEAMAIMSQAWTSLQRPETVALDALAIHDSPTASANQKQQIRAWIVEALRQHPGATLLKTALASMSGADNQIDEAVSRFRQTLASEPDNVGALNNLAWILGLSEPPQTEEALRHVDHAIEVEGSNPSLADTRAVVLIRAGRLDEALQEIKTAQQMPPRSQSLSRALAVHLAWAFHAKGQVPEARQAFQQALSSGYKPEAAGPLERRYISKLREDLGLADGATIRSGD